MLKYIISYLFPVFPFTSVNFKAAKGTLSGLADAGILSEKPAVMVCSYKNDEPQQEYVATYSGGESCFDYCIIPHVSGISGCNF